MARPHVPKFGDWEGEGNVPYTVYFDKARKGRGGPIGNPNDPSENPDLFPSNAAPPPSKATPSRFEEPMGMGRAANGRQPSSDDVGRRGGENQRKPLGRGDEDARSAHVGRPNRDDVGRGGNRGGGNSPVIAPNGGTPGRHQMKPRGRDDGMPSKAGAIPQFGSWDLNNPAAAEGYTVRFENVRKDRQTGDVRAPVSTSVQPSYNTAGHQQVPDHENDQAKSCCFPWGK